MDNDKGEIIVRDVRGSGGRQNIVVVDVKQEKSGQEKEEDIEGPPPVDRKTLKDPFCGQCFVEHFQCRLRIVTDELF